MTIAPSKLIRKAIPSPNDANFNDRVRESLMTYLGQQGSRLDRGVTLRDLSAAGINLSARFLATGQGDPFGGGLALDGPGGSTTVIGGPGSVYVPDLTPPPTPTGFTATAAITSLLAECSPASYTVGHGHFVSRLYGSKPIGAGADPTFSDAVVLGEFGGTVWAYVSEPATRWFLWLKWVSKDGVESISPAGGLHGIQVDTGQDVSKLLNAITKAAEDPTATFTKLAIRATMFYVVSDIPGATTEAGMFSVITAPITSGGVTVPAGTYIKDAYIQNGTITNLKVANGAIDNLKVANVSASKLTAGTISVGEYIESAGYLGGLSGWKINGAGDAELNNVVVRGFGFFGGGSVGGIIIEATRIRSSNYSGPFGGTGFMLGADGTLDIPDGTINAGKLNIGFGFNLLSRSSWVVRNGAVPEGWTYGGSLTYMTTLQVDTANDWTPSGSSAQAIYMVQTGRNGDTNIDGAYTDVSGGYFPCVAGQRYEFSAYLAAHRCSVKVYMGFLNSAGTALAYFSTADGTPGATGNALGAGGGGKSLAQYNRYGAFGIAPAGAAQAFMIIRKGDTYAGATDSYCFLPCGCHVAAAGKAQTVFSPYNPTGLGTLITPAGIVTPSIAALSANLGAINAGQVTIGSNAGGDWGYIRSPNKWLDGNWGWIMAQHPNGAMFVDFTIGSSRFYMYHNPGVSATMVMDTPGLYFDSNGTLQVRAANVINTLQIAGNAVTVPGYMEGGDQRGFPSAIGTVFNFDSSGTPIIAMMNVQNLGYSYFSGGQDGTSVTAYPQLLLQIQRSDGLIVWQGATLGGSLTAYFGGAGNAHYTLIVRNQDGSGNGTIAFRSMVLLTCKR
ncbi:hypothetical protein RCH10_000761 [Variovorax sp. GrIS 2.14]|uniref:phage tail tip fiber protein n=1 Tax=Variovorax sp. GrIS 2.14 TaxID=3071709 RepID=UPI0038F79720